MTKQKLAESLLFHANQIDQEESGIVPHRNIQAASVKARLAHLRWMCDEAATFILDPSDKLDKAMRWLGFIQGALWLLGVSTIEESKRANMPEGEEYKP